MTKRLIFFLHIPKTGGLTMRRLLDRQYAGKKTFRYPPQEPIIAIRKLSPERRSRLKCVYGHFSYGVHRNFQAKPIYITMLRDPLERIISMYYFIRSRPQNKLYMQANRLSFEQFVMSELPSIQMPLRNHQTRMVSGQHQPNLSIAKQNIQKQFAVVGITEMYPESVFMMKKVLGWNNVSYTKKNITKSRPKQTTVSPKIKELIRKNNALDYQLYAFAKKRLMMQIEQLNPQEKQQLARLKQHHARS